MSVVFSLPARKASTSFNISLEALKCRSLDLLLSRGSCLSYKRSLYTNVRLNRLISNSERDTLEKSAAVFNRYIRPLTSILAGIYYYIIANILVFIGLPYIKL